MEENENENDRDIGYHDGFNAGLSTSVVSYWLPSMRTSLLRQGRTEVYTDAFIHGFIDARSTWEKEVEER